jgi:hypothetical protein
MCREIENSETDNQDDDYMGQSNTSDTCKCTTSGGTDFWKTGKLQFEIYLLQQRCQFHSSKEEERAIH